ncbi:MAG: hypothetical protein Q7U56_08795 [Humidesulfovibrio sp.]|nr:hypothetical protein [Humidesulfovibrio sp.]
MTRESIDYFRVLSRVLEFAQMKVDQRLTDKPMLAFSYIVAAGGTCPLSEVVEYLKRVGGASGEGSKRGSHHAIARLEATYPGIRKTLKGLGLIISMDDPLDSRRKELRLSPQGLVAADAIAALFRSALTRVKT